MLYSFFGGEYIMEKDNSVLSLKAKEELLIIYHDINRAYPVGVKSIISDELAISFILAGYLLEKNF